MVGCQDHGRGETRQYTAVDVPETYTRKIWLDSLQDEPERTKPKMMHKVPDLLLANGNFKSYYQPKIVPLGPYHLGDPELRQFQKRKPSMADKLIPDKQFQVEMQNKIRSVISCMIDVYRPETKKSKISRKLEERWVKRFFLDGCFVLYFIFCIMHNRDEDLKMKMYEIDSAHKDLFLLENQLPYKLLKILSGDDPELLRLVFEYICTHKIGNDQSLGVHYPEAEPVHLLDYLHTIITSGQSESNKKLQEAGKEDTPPVGKKGPVLWHAKELIARGIHLNPNQNGYPMDIFFKSNFIYGTLGLPKIIVDNSTRPMFLNLAAYEMCSGVGSAITSYICFLDSLVNHAEDIKELQSAGILINGLPTNEDAAKLFNEMSEELRPDIDTYMDVKRKMQKFFKHKAKANLASWIAEGYYKHFKSPLTAMGVLAAILALGLTAVQTYFTVFPRGNK